MITRKNYLKRIAGVDLSKLDKKLLASKRYFDDITDGGTSWDEVDGAPIVESLIEKYFEALDIALSKLDPKYKIETERGIKTRSISSIKRTDPIILELRYLRRYINLDGKVKTKRQIGLFLKALQSSIISKQIRKSSQYAKHIEILQNDLIDLLESFGSKKSKRVTIDQAREMEILNLFGWEAESTAIKLLKRFVKLQGKTLDKAQIKKEHNKIARYLNRVKRVKGASGLRDKLSKKLLETTVYLKELFNGRVNRRVIAIDTKTLNGIQEVYEKKKTYQ